MKALYNRKHMWMMLMLALAALACNLTGGEPTEQAEVATVIVVVTETPVGATVSDEVPEPEEAAVADAPVLEAPSAEPGEPTMTALVDLNVRLGPDTQYEVVGVLRAGSAAGIIGVSPDGGWWKIECPPGVGTECWVSGGSQFSAAENVDTVAVATVPPLLAVAASPTPEQVAGVSATLPPATTTQTAQTTQSAQPTPTATETITTATQTSLVAQIDGDSQFNPAVSVNFRPTGQKEFTHSSDVSVPTGDLDDWVEFTSVASESETTRVWLTLSCTGDADSTQSLRATIWDGSNERLSLRVQCGAVEERLTVTSNHTYLVRVHFQSDGPYYAQYSLTVRGVQ